MQDIFAPRGLESWIGYDGAADLVGIHRLPDGLWAWSDGRRCSFACMFGWLFFLRDPVVDLYIRGRQPNEWLLFDRRSRRIESMPAETAGTILRNQWQSLLTGAEWRALIATLAGKPKPRRPDELPYWSDPVAEEAARIIVESLRQERRGNGGQP